MLSYFIFTSVVSFNFHGNNPADFNTFAFCSIQMFIKTIAL